MTYRTWQIARHEGYYYYYYLNRQNNNIINGERGKGFQSKVGNTSSWDKPKHTKGTKSETPEGLKCPDQAIKHKKSSPPKLKPTQENSKSNPNLVYNFLNLSLVYNFLPFFYTCQPPGRCCRPHRQITTKNVFRLRICMFVCLSWSHD